MFQLMFGMAWTLITGICIWGFYYGNGNITVNDVYVTQEEFNSMLFPKVLLGAFLLIGIVFIIVGLKKIIRDRMTTVKGVECFGRIINVYPSGTTVNEVPELMADVLIYMPLDGKAEIMSEVIGLSSNTEYENGCYVKVKQYKRDINFEERVTEDSIPLNIKQLLDDESKVFINDSKNKELNGI